MNRLFYTTILLLSCYKSLGWWENGHMLVAQIAKLDLQQSHPEVYLLAEEFALLIANTTFNLSTTFIEAAVWPDDIKNVGWHFWDEWHFVDIPYDPEGVFTPPEDSMNSPWAINQTLQVLTNYTTLGNATLEKSIMMRMMMHIVGDMHQPLHNAQYFSLLYPDGDQGGNLINVTYQGQEMVLHAFWDSIAGWLPTFSRPLNASSLEIFENLGIELMTAHPRTEFSDDLYLDPANWTDGIYSQAVEYAYNLLPEDFNITPEYQEIALDICKENIALAGYRLSDLIYYAISAQVPSTIPIQPDGEKAFLAQ